MTRVCNRWMESLENRLFLSGNRPVSPSSLVQSNQTTSSITLGWTDNSTNESGFRIDRLTTRGWITAGRVKANVLSFTDTRLKQARAYAYRVFAYNSAGNSKSSAFIGNAVTSIPVALPLTPTNFTVQSATPNAITLSWETAQNATSQLLYSWNGSAWANPISLDRIFTFYTISSLSPGTAYAYELFAVNAGGPSAFPAFIGNASTLPAPVPVAASNLIAVASSISSVSLNWMDNSSDEDSFRIDRLVGANWSFVGTAGRNVTSYTDLGVSPDQPYVYRVVAYNSWGDSISPPSQNVRTPVAAGVISDPTNLYATTIANGDIIVQLTDNATDEIGFTVEVSDNAGAWTHAGTIAGNSSTGKRILDFTSAKTGHAYAFRVTGFNSDHFSNTVGPVSATGSPAPFVRAATLASGKYYTFVTTNNFGNVALDLTAHRMNADGTEDSTFTPVILINGGGYPQAKVIAGLPDGNVLVQISSVVPFGNSAGFPGGSLYEMGDGGIGNRVALDAVTSSFTSTIGETYTVWPDGSVTIVSKTTPYKTADTLAEVQYVNFNSPTPLITSGQYLATPDSVTELPDGVAVARYGQYYQTLDADTRTFASPANSPSFAVAATSSGGKVKLTITGFAATQTAFLINRIISTSAFENDFANQINVGTLPYNNENGPLTFEDSGPVAGRQYQYTVTPIYGQLLGMAAISRTVSA